MNSEPKEDFGASIDHNLYGHPDPNLTYAKQLVKCMGLAENVHKHFLTFLDFLKASPFVG